MVLVETRHSMRSAIRIENRVTVLIATSGLPSSEHISVGTGGLKVAVGPHSVSEATQAAAQPGEDSRGGRAFPAALQDRWHSFRSRCAASRMTRDNPLQRTPEGFTAGSDDVLPARFQLP
jgi:hypothetical protein